MDKEKQIDALAQKILACEKCELRESCTAPVPGTVNPGAKYFIIGEAPGKDEDEQGVGFVGSSGKKLNKLLEVAGIDPNDCSFSNACRCRPPYDKEQRKQQKPTKKQVAKCLPYLLEEIKLADPEVIITAGSIPLGIVSDMGVKKIHGTMFRAKWGDVEYDTIAQYHPGAALHQPRLWATMLNDWEILPSRAEPGFILNGYQLGKTYEGTVAIDSEGTDRLEEWSVAYRDEQGKLVVDPYYGPNRNVHFNGRVVMHNAPWDIRVFRASGVDIPEQNYSFDILDALMVDKGILDDTLLSQIKRETKRVDTMVAAFCLGMGRQEPVDTGRSGDRMVGGLGLKYLARRHLGWEMVDWNPDIVDKVMYNAKDSAATFLLWEKWEDRLPQHFWTIDMPLQPVLMAMEDRGAMVDPDFLVKYTQIIDEELAQYDLPLNPKAPQELQSYIYGTLEIEPWKFTDGGQPSVEREVLETIDDPLVKDILRVLQLKHERGMYANDFALKLGADGRLHPSIKQTSAATARLSMARPNLQNLETESEREGREGKGQVRVLFIAPPGHKVVAADASQLDLRAYAALTQDPEMLRIFREGKSIHKETHAALPELEYKEAKTANFTWLYEGTAWKVSQQFHVPIDKAQSYLNTYFDKYKSIPLYHHHMKIIANEEQRVTDSWGRTVRIDAMFTNDRRILRAGERQAINYPVQMDEAEIVKRAMIQLHYRVLAPMILQIHDELLFYIPEAEAEEYAAFLRKFLPSVTEVNGLRFPWEVGIGNNWLEAKHNAK